MICCSCKNEFEPPKKYPAQKYCSKTCYGKRKQYTTEDYIKSAKMIHGDTFDYSGTVYINTRQKIKVRCIHGEKIVRPDSHLKYGCTKCTNIKRYGAESPFSKKARSREIYEKAKSTWLKKYGVDHPSKNPEIQKKMSAAWRTKSSDEIAIIQTKKSITLMKTYGVSNPSHSKEIIDKIHKVRIANGTRIELDLQSYENYKKYKKLVRYYSNRSYNEYREHIDPTNVRGKDWHLDHIFSIFEGFKRNISPKIIGHVSNLQLISSLSNLRKQEKCHKTEQDLFEDYNNFIS